MHRALTAPRTHLRLEYLEDRCTPSYTITDLGTLGGNGSQAFGINDSGQVVGASQLAGNQTTRAFIWTNGTMLDIGTLGGQNSAGYAINDLGWVTGTSLLPSGNNGHAFLYDGTTMQDLGTLGGVGSSGFAINDAGHVAGQSDRPTGVEHAFLFKNGIMRDLGSLGGPVSVATAINSSGQVVGYAQKPNFDNHAFSHNGISSRGRDLGTLGGSQSFAYDISDSAEVIGCSDTADGKVHVFRFKQGQMTDLGIPSNCNWMAINNHGHFVGIMPGPGPFLYKDGVVTNLNDLLPPGSNWIISEARDINDVGQMVGYGDYLGKMHAFLLSPDRSEAPPAPTISNYAVFATADFEDGFRRVSPRVPVWTQTTMLPTVASEWGYSTTGIGPG